MKYFVVRKMNHLNTLLEKTSDWDKDERYMATNDLMNELIKGQSQLGPKMDELMERVGAISTFLTELNYLILY